MAKPDPKAAAANLASQTVAALSTLADEIQKHIDELTDETLSTGERAYRQARQQVRGATHAVIDTVEDRPLIMLLAVGLIATSIGFLLGRR